MWKSEQKTTTYQQALSTTYKQFRFITISLLCICMLAWNRQPPPMVVVSDNIRFKMSRLVKSYPVLSP